MSRPKSHDKDLPPRVQGYYASALFDDERKVPAWHSMAGSKAWRAEWLAGYDEGKQRMQDKLWQRRNGDETLFRIVAPHFVAGGEARDGICFNAAPIIRYMVGWNGQQVADYCKRKGWSVERVRGTITPETQELRSLLEVRHVPDPAKTLD